MNIFSTRIRRTALAGLLASSSLIATQAATADPTTNNQVDGETLTVEQASHYLRYSGGSDRYRIELAPNYSEELGFSMKGAAGGYLSDEIALGLIVEYGENKREYLGNAGIQFTDALSLVGTVGLLEERNEYVKGDGRELVQQMEYGASLKGAYQVGVLSGFELNGYLANAEADSKNVETGRLYGIQLLADFDLTSTTNIEIGGGYEWLEWDNTNDDDNQFTFSADAVQQLGDQLSLTGNVKLGASEYVYGGGLAFDLSNGGLNTNSLSLNYNYIDGRHGIEDDQRVELSWTYGFGAGPTQTASVETQGTGNVRPVADVAMVSPANNLLNDVMKRPAFLPERVLARGTDAGLPTCSKVGVNANSFGSGGSLGTINSITVFGENIGLYLTIDNPESTSVSVDGIPLVYGGPQDAGAPFIGTTDLLVVGKTYPLTVNGTTCSVTAVGPPT